MRNFISLIGLMPSERFLAILPTWTSLSCLAGVAVCGRHRFAMTPVAALMAVMVLGWAAVGCRPAGDFSGQKTAPGQHENQRNESPLISAADDQADLSQPSRSDRPETTNHSNPSSQALAGEPGRSSSDAVDSSQRDATDQRSNPIRYWIGIQSQPAPKALLDQFDLKCGLVVTHVVEGGPSAGRLQVSDVIYRFNGNPISCQKRLCKVIAEASTQPAVLSVVRKTQQLEIEVQPQRFEVLGSGQIVQYTVFSEDDDSAPQVGLPYMGASVTEKFRLFVIQPSLQVGDFQADTGSGDSRSTDKSSHSSGAAGPGSEASAPGQWHLERIASFRYNEAGERILVVRERDRVVEYTESEIENACQELRKLNDLIENGP
jgi:hypothetical protein